MSGAPVEPVKVVLVVDVFGQQHGPQHGRYVVGAGAGNGGGVSAAAAAEAAEAAQMPADTATASDTVTTT